MIAQPHCGREVSKQQRRRPLRAGCVDSYSLVVLPCDAFLFDVIARSVATKQSILSSCCEMDCFAPLAMTPSLSKSTAHRPVSQIRSPENRSRSLHWPALCGG